MNVTDFTYLLQYPEKMVSPVQTKQLEDILEEYPYFQAARALHLKGLKNLNSFKFNNALKVTAAYTSERDILFDFITSNEFLQNTIADTISGRDIALKEKEVSFEEITPNLNIKTIQEDTIEDKPLPTNIKEAEQILDDSLFTSKDPEIDKHIAETKKATEELEIGTPILFTRKEKYSFGEWLQLTANKPIEINTDTKKEETIELDTPTKKIDIDPIKKKFDLIDKFIEANPKIVATENPTKVKIENSLKIDKAELMTETLAKVYLEQKKYKKAIQAYKILSLKYPEKSSSFADRIKAVEKLQQKK